MSLTSLLTRGRAAAERLMTDTCVITRVTGTTTNPDTGQTYQTTAQVYSGKCKLQQRSASANPAEVGQAHLLIQAMELHVPWDTAGLAADQRATVTLAATGAVVTVSILGVLTKSHTTAQRMSVTEVTS